MSFKQLADSFTDIAADDFTTAAEKIRNMHIDVLFDMQVYSRIC